MIVALKVLNDSLDILAINQTYISLVLKVKNPTMVAHFRTISLCNVLYKIISKVLAKCL